MRKLGFWNYIVLAILGGTIGLQEFYTKKTIWGVLAVVFCWTCVPAVVALIEAIVWLFKGEEEFNFTFNK